MPIQGGNGATLTLISKLQNEGNEGLRKEANNKMMCEINNDNNKNDRNHENEYNDNQDLANTPQGRVEGGESFDYMVIDDVIFPEDEDEDEDEDEEEDADEDECNPNLSNHSPHIFTFNTDSIGSVSDE